MSNPIDTLMEQASQKLAAMEYLDAEQLCLSALAAAKAAGDFDRYSRIVLPLQEARRQRRQIAADAGVAVLGEPRRTADQILDAHRQGCLLLIDPPYSADDEAAIRRLAAERKLYIEVLRANQDSLRSGFEYEMERQGDAALAALDSKQPARRQLEALESALPSIGDHEIAHQRLAQLARLLIASPAAG